ncbi:MAG: hypothetical protein PHH57_04670 [Candidatus Omnitrophica bacterium]|nr:hypothetical protein [Candidatus Omnitrophota bacterium]
MMAYVRLMDEDRGIKSLGKMAFYRRASGQGFIEYAMLIIIVSAALIAMTIYLMRSTNACLKQRQTELNYYRSE